MKQLNRRIELGFRWIRCGWRLFARNPYLLGGMGGCSAALIALLGNIPFFGTPLIGLVAPTLLAGMYIALEGIAKQKLKLPPGLRLPAVKLFEGGTRPAAEGE